MLYLSIETIFFKVFPFFLSGRHILNTFQEQHVTPVTSTFWLIWDTSQ